MHRPMDPEENEQMSGMRLLPPTPMRSAYQRGTAAVAATLGAATRALGHGMHRHPLRSVMIASLHAGLLGFMIGSLRGGPAGARAATEPASPLPPLLAVTQAAPSPRTPKRCTPAVANNHASLHAARTPTKSVKKSSQSARPAPARTSSHRTTKSHPAAKSHAVAKPTHKHVHAAHPAVKASVPQAAHPATPPALRAAPRSLKKSPKPTTRPRASWLCRVRGPLHNG